MVDGFLKMREFAFETKISLLELKNKLVSQKRTKTGTTDMTYA